MTPMEDLTNEQLSKLYNDNFQLAFDAIQRARNEVRRGADTNLHKILRDVRKNPHLNTFEETVISEDHLA